jgi:hypothetical protein
MRTVLKRIPATLAVVLASGAIAFACALAVIGNLSPAPPFWTPKHLSIGSAVSHVMVDTPESQLTDRRATWEYFNEIGARADVLAQLMASAPVVDRIAERAGMRHEDIAAFAPVTATVVSVLTEPGSEQRAREIELSTRPYRLEIQSRTRAPLIDIYTQAPTVEEARRLADAAVEGLRTHLEASAVEAGLDPEEQVRLEPLGPTRGAVINAGAAPKIALLCFIVSFGLACSLLLALARRRRRPRATSGRNDGDGEDPAHAPASRPAARPAVVAARREPPDAGAVALPWGVAATPALRLSRPRLDIGQIATQAGDWPRTTRVLPWMVAAFLAVLWLVPFDSIQLNIPSPIDLKFDRLVLPILGVTWLLTLVLGDRYAPRVRPTWIHAAVGLFVALAFLSVVFDAGSLNRELELDTAIKKLPLLLGYLSVFVIIASVVRRSEVSAFLGFTLILAVICALGMLWEYKLGTNLFYDWSSRLLPGPFEVGVVDSGYDLGGRRGTRGPAAHGLVAVAMLALAIAIAVARMIHANRWRDRLLYGLAVAILFGGMLATQRKTSIIAPVSAIATLAYFRRRELLKLTPIGVAALVTLLIASPGTLTPVLDQFRPDRLGANTVSDRASDYDAIRPDVWTHLALGRGYGSYQPVGHRILDSEVLVRTVEMGVLGLCAFVLLGLAVILAARSTIVSRHPRWAPSALAGAAAAVVFLVVGTLFDTMSFPQVPYIFLSLAALTATLVADRSDAEED